MAGLIYCAQGMEQMGCNFLECPATPEMTHVLFVALFTLASSGCCLVIKGVEYLQGRVNQEKKLRLPEHITDCLPPKTAS